MFILNDRTQLEKAIAKAMKVRTSVKFIEFGVYSVRGTQGNFYTVKCEKIGNQKQVICECKAADKGLVCYHAAGALSLHIGLARQRQTA
jgi:3-keto-L-gulonate-6-phosphate decarboxylase